MVRSERVLQDIRVIALACLATVALIYALPRLISPLWLILPLGLCLVRAFAGRRLVVAVCVMAAWTLIDAEAHLARIWPIQADGTSVWVTGRVVGLPQDSSTRSRFVLRTQAQGQRLRLSWYRHAPLLEPGECLRLKLRLSSPRSLVNPGGFDYARWLWRKHIDATGYVQAQGFCDASPDHSLDRLRAGILARLAPVLSGTSMRGIIEALTLGVRQHITQAQWATLRATGTSHLVAISGLHIGLIAALLFGLARWLALRYRPTQRHARVLACVLAFIGASAYAGLAGWALPTQRALIMVGMGLLALATEQSRRPSRALALAGIAVLVFNPAAVLAPGFWLSFSAVGWLIWIGSTVRGPLWLRWAWFQFGLVIALTPLTLWFFGQASMIAPLVNALLIPASAAIVPCVLFAVLAAVLWPAGGGLLLVCVAKAMAVGWAGLRWAATMPHVSVAHHLAGVALLGAWIVGMLFLAAPIPWRIRALGAVIVLPVVLAFVRPDNPIAPGQMRLTVLDVGEGLAVVVRTANHTLLYDAGPATDSGFDTGKSIVVPYLRRVGRPRLDVVVASGDDRAHIGGIPAVVRLAQPRRTIGLAERGAPCRPGEHWRWDGVDFRIVAAAKATHDCVVHVTSRRGSVLLTADIRARGEQKMVASVSRAALASDVLLVPHYGSATSSSPALLTAVAPRVAVVSSAWHNRWRYPRPIVVSRYRTLGAALYNTATDGALTIRWSGDHRPAVSRARRHYRHFWQTGPASH